MTYEAKLSSNFFDGGMGLRYWEIQRRSGPYTEFWTSNNVWLDEFIPVDNTSSTGFYLNPETLLYSYYGYTEEEWLSSQFISPRPKIST